MEKYYLVIDIGTGNYRVGLVSQKGTVKSLETRDMIYEEDDVFSSATSFNPQKLFNNIKKMIVKIIEENSSVEICGITSTSQRQGIVLMDKEGKAFVGIPNIDKRGQDWELSGQEYEDVYKKTGSWPTSTFSAVKLKGVREHQPKLWCNIASFTSISDWIGYEFTRQIVYENAQASDTLLLDIERNNWSMELVEFWGIDENWLPEIKTAGTILGLIDSELSQKLMIKSDIPFIIGGSDTQLAVKGTNPEVGDVVIVSGTTSPIVKVNQDYYYDEHARCCVNRHVNKGQYVIETNGGASGLNYQRLKKLLLPDKSYEEIENDILQIEEVKCIASFSTLNADDEFRLSSGGFLLETPFQFNLGKEDFIYGVILDIACTITYNFRLLTEITGYSQSYVFGCSGGFQSRVLPQMLSNLLNKEIIIKEGYKDASLIGAVNLCNEALGEEENIHSPIKRYKPSFQHELEDLYTKWLKFRKKIN